MADIDRATEFPDGITFGDTLFLQGTGDPSVSGEVAPLGSILSSTTGKIWRKHGAADTDWSEMNDSVAASGISESNHRDIDQLVHNIAETNYTDVVRASGHVTDIVIWETSSKLKKIRETNIARASGRVSQTIDKQYDESGTLVETLTSTMNRLSGKIEYITETLT